MSLSILSAVVSAVHILGLSSSVAGQASGVVCGSNYTWAENSFRQNPCIVASYLQGVCSSGGFTVQPLPPNTHYAPPEANECECNTVVYSLISACADCQGSFYSTWDDWSMNCTGVYIQTFPEAIPAGTAVPAWAYEDVLIAGTYSPAAAESDSGPESTAPTSTRTATSTRTTTTVSTPFPSITIGPVTISSSKKVNAGAIAGGVVGGLAGLAIIGGLIAFLVMRNRRSQTAPSAAYMDTKVPVAAPPPMTTYAPSSYAPGSPGSYAPGSPVPYSVPPSTTTSPPPGSQYSTEPFLAQQRPYDPSDPSTFPTDAGAAGHPGQSASPGFPPQAQQFYPSQPTSPVYGVQSNAAYTGTPQV